MENFKNTFLRRIALKRVPPLDFLVQTMPFPLYINKTYRHRTVTWNDVYATKILYLYLQLLIGNSGLPCNLLWAGYCGQDANIVRSARIFQSRPVHTSGMCVFSEWQMSLDVFLGWWHKVACIPARRATRRVPWSLSDKTKEPVLFEAASIVDQRYMVQTICFKE